MFEKHLIFLIFDENVNFLILCKGILDETIFLSPVCIN